MSRLREAGETVQVDLANIRAAQARWAAAPVAQRVRMVRALRQAIADHGTELAAKVPLDVSGQLNRTLADTLCSEVLPLAEACRFLESEAKQLLAPVKHSNKLRPIWLGGVEVETRREALGVVLIIAPGNYPLLLAGVQALQALTAGNAVLWKPAPGGAAVAHALRELLVDCGLDEQLLTVLHESPEAAQAAIKMGVDKVVLTGSAKTGRAVLGMLADKLTPAVMELSGCDAVFVLEGADLGRVAAAIAFGLRFNGSATCMAPRRLICSEAMAQRLIPELVARLSSIAPVRIPKAAHTLLNDMVDEATLYGARVLLNGLKNPQQDGERVGPTLLDRAEPTMRIAQADIFAPVLSVICAETDDAMLAVHAACKYSLTAAVFGMEERVKAFARRVHAGTVLVNDVIVASADPRVSFGGRGLSGFGSTRGAEGLLEMTAVKNVIVQRSRSRRAWQPTTAAHAQFFAALLSVLHGRGWRARTVALRALVKAARGFKA